MNLAYVSAILDAPAAKVWSVIGDFHGMAEWVAMITTSVPESDVGVGSIRRVTVDDGRVVRERLVAYDDPGRRYSYEFADEPAPFPVRSYLGTLHLLPITESDQTFLEWYGEFDCEAELVEENRAMFTGIYTVFIGDLRGHLKALP
ncbi:MULTISPECIES: SRPBCC family protein [unclassified Mycobacterium]|uniref:SRPBCC family protein n=1 Tax=unclassified Mycobacterium TaxID=2642494 RepID=UPI0029C613E6|nr:MULTISPECIES: SRPBCC family protein [unclassified Mycobacterium]